MIVFLLSGLLCIISGALVVWIPCNKYIKHLNKELDKKNLAINQYIICSRDKD